MPGHQFFHRNQQFTSSLRVPQMKNYHNLFQNRRGVTLLFVVSMIVLFLLMGTAFVVVSNDFLRANKIVSRITVKSNESVGEQSGQRFLQRAFLDLLRGPNLNNVNSPLRGHSILADMYGYGFTSYIKNIDFSTDGDDRVTSCIQASGQDPNQAPQFFRISLVGSANNIHGNSVTFDDLVLSFEDTTNINIDDFRNDDAFVIANNVFNGKPIFTAMSEQMQTDLGSGADELPAYDMIPSSPGQLNGQLLSIVSGPAAGLTTRIIDHQVFPIEDDGSGSADTEFINDIRYGHRFVVMVVNNQVGVEISNLVNLVTSFDDLLEEDSPDDPQTEIPTRVLINGRAFAGTGGGTFHPLVNFNVSAITRAEPNLAGMSLSDLVSEPNYLSRRANTPATNRTQGIMPVDRDNNYATNETHDSVDEHNWFLGGTSYTHGGRNSASASFSGDITFNGGRYTVDDDRNGAGGFAAVDGTIDNDGDGIPDSIFIDIGLPAFVNEDGVRVKPLVAYRVVDLDSKININVHGNRSQIEGNDRFSSSTATVNYPNAMDYDGDGVNESFEIERTALSSNPRGFAMPGNGFGPSEVFLESFFMDDWNPEPSDTTGVLRKESARLIIGDVDIDRIVRVPGRLGVDNNTRRLINAGGPAPGSDEIETGDLPTQELFSRYSLLGYPDSGIRLPSTLGGIYQSAPLDIYGRFVSGYPQVTSGFSTSMPNIDVGNSTIFDHAEIVNHPYETTFSLTSNGGNFDQLYSLDELERVYRQGDDDLVGTSIGRLAILAPSLDRRSAATDDNPVNDFNYLNFTTDSYEVPTSYQGYVRGDSIAGELSMGDLGSGLQTLVGKLYSILSIEGNPNYGLSNATVDNTPNSVADRVTRHREIMANIIGYTHDVTVDDPVNDRTLSIDPNFRKMLSSELLAGLPFDINRPFGNGVDNGGFPDVVDDLSENDSISHPNGSTFVFDYDGDSAIPANAGTNDAPYLNRQQFARQLYVLTLLATEFVDRTGDGRFLDNADFTYADDLAANDLADRKNYRRVIAQWAINVADFRDPDSIRTPFEVDLNPFNGWDTDGDLTTTNDTDASDPTDRVVVWGAERPDLLITETFAMHNKRIQDTADDPSGEATGEDSMDSNFDSLMAPVAAAFFELYYPEHPEEIRAAELDPSQDGIDLAKLDPDNNPIFRLKVVQGTGVNGGSNPPNPPFNPLVDPDLPSSPPFAAKRYIYFNEPDPASLSNEGIDPMSVFASTAGNEQLIEPGNFAIVGSTGVDFNGFNTTFLGRRSDVVFDETTDLTTVDLKLDETRRIELDQPGREVRVYDSEAGNNVTSANVTILPFSGPVSRLIGDRRSAGLSDPYDGYGGITDEPGGNILEVVENEPGLDGPYFAAGGVPATANFAADFPTQAGSFPGHGGPATEVNGVYSSVYVVLLQRLADPTRPFDRLSNPYLTMDSISTDLVVFNGTDVSGELAIGMGGLERDALHFGTYERRSNMIDANFGQPDRSMAETNIRFRELWKTDYNGLQPGNESVDNPDSVNHIFMKDLIHSFGQINSAYANDNAASGSPYPWLTWNNRPFNNAYELTLVPFGNNFFLTSQFDVSLKDAGLRENAYQQHVETNASTMQNQAVRGSVLSGEFPHLLNFHGDGPDSPLLNRVLDFVEVPSPYLGTRQYLNPSDFEGSGGATQLTRNFVPPFDYVSNFRYPGKINVNTISDFRVWNALMGVYATNEMDTDADGLLDEQFEAVKDLFADDKPLRANSALNYVTTKLGNNETLDSSEPGLFRRRMADQALLDYEPTTANDPLDLASRNAYFKYHPRNRLGNLVTNRSSVFAIWISIRNFEVVSEDLGNGVVVDTISDQPYRDPNTERVETSRAFFVVDRSIPVAFEPGRNHNVERAVRVSSYIENQNLAN